jgi:hypothetical protein
MQRCSDVRPIWATCNGSPINPARLRTQNRCNNGLFHADLIRTQQPARDGRTRWKWACFRSGGRTPIPTITAGPSLFPPSHTPSPDRLPCGFPAYAPKRQAGDGAYHVPRIADSAVAIRDASPFRVCLSRSCANNDVLFMWTRATWQRAFWPWPNSRFGHSVVIRVQLTVHIRYPFGTSLASRPPSCWQSPCVASRPAHATEVGDVVRWASHRPVASPACHRRLPLVVQQVTAWRGATHDRAI